MMRSGTLVVVGVLALAGCAAASPPISRVAPVRVVRASDAEMQHLESHALIDVLIAELRVGGVVRLDGGLSRAQARSGTTPGYTDIMFLDAEVSVCVLRLQYRGQPMSSSAAGAPPTPGRGGNFSRTIPLTNVDPDAILADEAVPGDRYRRIQGKLHLVRLFAAEGSGPIAPGRGSSNREALLFVRDADSAVRTASIVRELVVRCRR